MTNNIETKINKIENDILYNKYIIAFQDLINILLFEHMDQNIETEIFYLKLYSVSGFHYFNKKMFNTKEDLYNHIFVLNEKIKAMPKDIYDDLNKYYPNLIKSISQQIEKILLKNDKDIERIYKWWNR